MKAWHQLDQSGQAMAEWLIGLVLLLVPSLIAGGYVLRSQWEKSKCIYQTFRKARSEVIYSRATSSPSIHCGDSVEQLTLVPAEDLDTDKGGLDLGDAESEVSQFWERFSSWQSSPLLSGSSK